MFPWLDRASVWRACDATIRRSAAPGEATEAPAPGRRAPRSAISAGHSRHGQRESETSAGILPVLCPDVATLRLDDMPCDGEAKARATPVTRRIGLVEPLENASLLAAGDARPRVRHAKGDGIGRGTRADDDGAARR